MLFNRLRSVFSGLAYKTGFRRSLSLSVWNRHSTRITTKKVNTTIIFTQKSKLPGLGSQPFNSTLKQIRSFAEDDGLIIRAMLAMKGSLNLYSTRDEASLFPGISFKKDKFKAKVLQVKGKRKKKRERKKERGKEKKKESKQINGETVQLFETNNRKSMQVQWAQANLCLAEQLLYLLIDGRIYETTS